MPYQIYYTGDIHGSWREVMNFCARENPTHPVNSTSVTQMGGMVDWVTLIQMIPKPMETLDEATVNKLIESVESHLEDYIEHEPYPNL